MGVLGGQVRAVNQAFDVPRQRARRMFVGEVLRSVEGAAESLRRNVFPAWLTARVMQGHNLAGSDVPLRAFLGDGLRPIFGLQVWRANWAGCGVVYRNEIALAGRRETLHPELVELRVSLESWAGQFAMHDLLEDVCYVLAWWAEKPERATSAAHLTPPSVDLGRVAEIPLPRLVYVPDSESRAEFVERATAALNDARAHLAELAEAAESEDQIGPSVATPEIRSRGGKTMRDRMRWLALTHCAGASERSLSLEANGESGIGRSALAEALDATAELVGITRNRLPAPEPGKHTDHAG